MTLFSAIYLLWMAWRLARSDSRGGGTRGDCAPGFWSAPWDRGLTLFASFSAFVQPLGDRTPGILAFAALLGTTCWASLALWACGSARMVQGPVRRFNRVMALILTVSVA